MKVGYSFEGLVNRVTAVDESAVHKTGDETVAGLKTFSTCPATTGVQGTTNTHLTRRDFVVAELNKKVNLTGAQTIDGAKTFSSNLTALAFLSSAEQNTAANAATRKDYVDAGLAKKLNLTGGTLTGNLTAPAVLVSSTQNTSVNALTRKDYVDNQVASKVSKTGDTMTGNLFAPAVLVSSAQNASANALTRKDYVDSAIANGDALQVSKSGDTMTGNLTAPKFLLSTSQSAEPNSVVRRDFLDSTVAGLNAGNSTMKLNIWEALSRSYAEVGYNVVGTFQAGFTLVNANDIGIDEATGKGYTGPAGKVDANTDPTSGVFIDRSGLLLRDDFGSKSFAADFDRSGCKIAVIPRDLSLTTGQIDVFRKTAANWWMLEQFVTGRPSVGASINNNCQAWRLGPQFRCHNVMTVRQATTYKDPSISSFSMIPSHFFNGGANRPTVDLLQFTGHNQSAEYTITADAAAKYIGILFAGGPNTTDFIVSFLQGGNEIYSETIKTKMSGGNPLVTFSRSIPNPANGVPTPLVIRVTSNSSDIAKEYGYCGGVCCELDDMDKQADTLLYTPATDAIEFEIRPTQSGAMCYVFQEANTQLFGGESHGGETVTSSTFRVDGTTTTLSVDKLVVANTFDINQTGKIVWPNGAQVDFNTIHGIYSKNDTTFAGRFYPSAGFTASLVYCPMLTLSSKNWRRMTYPVGIDANTLPDPKSYNYTGHLNGITMQSITNRMRAGIRFSSTILESDALKLEIKPYADFSTKIYMGQNTQGKSRPVTAFTTEQVRFVV